MTLILAGIGEKIFQVGEDSGAIGAEPIMVVGMGSPYLGVADPVSCVDGMGIVHVDIGDVGSCY